MRQFLLISLFGVLLSDIMLNLGLTLGPGLSLKNAFLYVIFLGLVAELAIGKSDSLRETWVLHTSWLILTIYASFTFLAVILLGVHRGYPPIESFIALKGRVFDPFMFLLVYLYGPRDIKSTLNLLCWLVAIFAIVNIVTLVDVMNVPNLGIISDRADGRLTGPVNEVNQYGGILIFIIPITAGLTVATSGWLRRFFAVGTLVGFVLLGLTVSRGSYFGLFVGGLFALYLVRDHIQKSAIIKGFVGMVVVVAIAGVAVAYLNPEGFLAKFDFGNQTIDRVSSGRTLFWRQSLTMMSYWPYSFVTGYGWNAYYTLFLGYGDPHNSYLLYWFNLGIIGIGSLLFIATWIVRFSVSSLNMMPKEIKSIVIGFIVGFLALHVALFFVAIYTPWLFIWAISGAILRLIVEYRRIAARDAASSPAVKAE